MQELDSIPTLEKILKQAEKTPAVIFKHSSTCPVSAAACERVEIGLNENRFSMPVYRINVQDSRDLSNRIASVLRVTHESPQAILLKRGIAAYVANHDNITVDGLLIALKME